MAIADPIDESYIAEPMILFENADEQQIVRSGPWLQLIGPGIRDTVEKPAWLKDWSDYEYAYHHEFQYNLTEIVGGSNLTETAMRWLYVVMTGGMVYVDITNEETLRFKDNADETEIKFLWATGLTYEDWCFNILEPLCDKLDEQSKDYPEACVFENQRDAVFSFIDILHSRPEGVTDTTAQEFKTYLLNYKSQHQPK